MVFASSRMHKSGFKFGKSCPGNLGFWSFIFTFEDAHDDEVFEQCHILLLERLRFTSLNKIFLKNENKLLFFIFSSDTYFTAQ